MQFGSRQKVALHACARREVDRSSRRSWRQDDKESEEEAGALVQKRVLKMNRRGALCLVAPAEEEGEEEEEEEEEELRSVGPWVPTAATPRATACAGYSGAAALRFDADDGGHGVRRPRFGVRGKSGASVAARNIVMD